MARDINKFLIKITDEPTWESMLEVSESKVVLLDIHQDWCGHCEAIQPTILRVLLDYDDAEDRFAYYSSNLTKNMETLKAFFPSDSNINLEKHGCLPLFLIIRNKMPVAVITGVDAPSILQQISMNIPDIKPRE